MNQQIFKYILAVNIILFSLLFISCNDISTSDEKILFDFESDHELDEVHWKCHSLMAISNQHATHGKRSLKLELHPSQYPGFNPFTKISDWRPFKSLCFDVYNPGDKDQNLTVRIDDRKDNTEYADRYNKRYILKQGMNHIEIKMDSLVTTGTNRKMDTSKIYKFLFFMYKPTEKVVLYVDYIRLVPKGRI